MPDREVDILLKFTSDTSGANVGGGKLASDLANVERVARAAEQEFNRLAKAAKQATTPAEFNAIERQLKDVEKQVKEVTNAYRAQARVLRAEAASLSSDYAKAQLDRQRQLADQIGGMSRTAFGVGVGVIGGSIAWATKYVNDAKQATEVTRAWKAEQEKLAAASNRFGATLATQALPLLRTAAELATKASQFAEDNPEIIRAALNTGVALATLGAVGMAVSKGIKIYADIQTLALGVQQLAAAKLQDTAADKQLAAAALQARMAGANIGGAAGTLAKGAGGLGTAGGGVAATLGSVVKVILPAIIAGLVTDKVFDKIQGRDVQMKDYVVELKQIAALMAGGAGFASQKIYNAIPGTKDIQGDRGMDWFKKVSQALGLLKTEADSTADSLDKIGLLENSSALEGILKAYDKYKTEDIQLVQDHYRERNEIIKSALQAEQDANKEYAAAVAKVNASASSQLAALAANFANANQQAEIKYEQDRAKIIADGARDIEKIQKDSQERLQKLAEDHNDRVADLTAARDALGLAKENRDYKRSVADEKKGTAEEIKERKRQTAERLAELKQSYDQERAQRLAEYIARQVEIKAQAAERLKELAIEHAEELKKIREQKAAKLKELDTEFAEERKRRYNQMVQQLKDLDAGLFAINQLEKAYMQARIAEIQAIINSANTAATNTPGMATGGYASFGKYTLGERGREYVLTNRTTQAAEAIMGGRLTQDRILSTLARGGAMVNYSGRFSGEYTASMRRQVHADVNRAISQALAGV